MATAQTAPSARRGRRASHASASQASAQRTAGTRRGRRPPAKPTRTDSQPLKPDQEHKEPLQIQILEKMSQLMTAAFGLVAALAWNDAMKFLIAEAFGSNQQLRILFGYAVLITIIAVLASLWVANITHKVKAALGHGHPPTTA